MQQGKISVITALEGDNPGGYIIVFSEGSEKHPVHFPSSFFKTEKKLDFELFLLWAAKKSPFQKINISVPLMMELASLIEEKISKL